MTPPARQCGCTLLPQALQLLSLLAADACVWQGITGAFRPGVLTALMGASGAGKTTLMDVLADRKTGLPPTLVICVILLLPCQFCFRTVIVSSWCCC